jgi:hypothetical protein
MEAKTDLLAIILTFTAKVFNMDASGGAPPVRPNRYY